MRTATLITTLTGLTTAMAIAAPIVVFGFLYVLQVHPERHAAAESRHRLAMAREELNRQQLFVKPQPVVSEVSALAEFESRTAEGEGVGDVIDILTAVLESPAVGGVSNVGIETGVPEDAPDDSAARLFSQTVRQTPVTLSFDARYEQIGRFFWNLRVLPTTFTLQSVALAPGTAGGPMMHATVSLVAFHRPGPDKPLPASRAQVMDVITSPRWTRNPFASEPRADARRAVVAEPDPVVTSILFSSGRRVAMVDGHIVGAGDRVRTGVIRRIDADAVVVAGPDGRERRVPIARPVVRLAKR
jgi:hypothetical protein